MPVDYQMSHLGGNCFCSIAIEVTGKNYRKHDIYEMCVILIDNFVRPSQLCLPFYSQICPMHLEDVVITNKITHAVSIGMMPTEAAEQFESWIEELDAPKERKIVPLVYNWGFVSPFLERLLGHLNFNYLISRNARDIQSVAAYIDDCRNQRSQPKFYPFMRLPVIAEQHGLKYSVTMDIMEKCLRQIEIYKLMLGVANF